MGEEINMHWETEFGLLTIQAANLHQEQTRKGKRQGDFLRVPYIIHPLQVVQRVQRWGIDEPTKENQDFWKALLFHDAIEDTTATSLSLVRLIGVNAASIVTELTKSDEESKEFYMKSFASIDKSVEALVGKIADRLCNVDDFRQDSPKYALKYYEKATPIFSAFAERKAEIVERFGRDQYNRIGDDFSTVYNEL